MSVLTKNQMTIKALETKIRDLEGQLYLNPVTRCPNELSLKNEIQQLSARESFVYSFLLILTVDNIYGIRQDFDPTVADEHLAAIASHLKSSVPDPEHIYHISDHSFAYLHCCEPVPEYEPFAEKLRLSFEDSEAFIRPTTVSIGGIRFSECPDKISHGPSLSTMALGEAFNRLKQSKIRGSNRSTLTNSMSMTNENILRVLIVDDDPLQLEFIRQALLNTGFKTDIALDGEEALNLASKLFPALIIAEYSIPKLNALRLKRTLDENPYLRNIPILLMTRMKSAELVSQAMDLQIYHILEKPLVPREIEGLCRYLIHANTDSTNNGL